MCSSDLTLLSDLHSFPTRRSSDRSEERRVGKECKFQTLHQVSTFGSFLLGIGFFVVLFNLLHSLFKGKKAPANPFHATTLEWTHTQSPPISHNFDEQPIYNHEPYIYEDELHSIHGNLQKA